LKPSEEKNEKENKSSKKSIKMMICKRIKRRGVALRARLEKERREMVLGGSSQVPYVLLAATRGPPRSPSVLLVSLTETLPCPIIN
jgi:hypothetical protein